MEFISDVRKNTYMLELDYVRVVDGLEEFSFLPQKLDAVLVQVLPFDDLNNAKFRLCRPLPSQLSLLLFPGREPGILYRTPLPPAPTETHSSLSTLHSAAASSNLSLRSSVPSCLP